MLYLLIIWFVTCRHWWYHILLIPISMFLFQIIILVNWEMNEVDTLEMYWLLPIIATVLMSLYYTRKKIKKTALMLDLKLQLDEAINKAQKEINTPNK